MNLQELVGQLEQLPEWINSDALARVRADLAAEPENRHDVPQVVQRLIEVALSSDLIDVPDLIVLVLRAGGDWASYATELCETAFADRHSKEGQAKHSRIVDASDRLLAEVRRSAAPNCPS